MSETVLYPILGIYRHVHPETKQELENLKAALAAKDDEIERLRGVVYKVSETRDELHAERDSLKRQLAEARRALEVREARIAAAREAMIAGILSLADAIDNGFDASDLSHGLREMAAQAREEGA